jgi:hypothetical protein
MEGWDSVAEEIASVVGSKKKREKKDGKRMRQCRTESPKWRAMRCRKGILCLRLFLLLCESSRGVARLVLVLELPQGRIDSDELVLLPELDSRLR